MVEPPLHRVTRTAQHSTTAPRLPSTLPLDSHRPTAPRAGICKLPSAEFPQGPHPIGPQQVLSWVCDIYFSAILKGTLANETVYHLFASQIKRKWWFHCWRFSLFFYTWAFSGLVVFLHEKSCSQDLKNWCYLLIQEVSIMEMMPHYSLNIHGIRFTQTFTSSLIISLLGCG